MTIEKIAEAKRIKRVRASAEADFYNTLSKIESLYNAYELDMVEYIDYIIEELEDIRSTYTRL